MSDWKQKRFWDAARAVEQGDGWTVRLDDKSLKTPAKRTLEVPTRALAQAVAAEWDAQDGLIDPLSMPMTRSVNATLDKVMPQIAEVAEVISAYGETDLLCYRAEGPEGLQMKQAEAWDPLLDWARSALGADLEATAGIVPIAQPEASITRLEGRVREADPFALTALHDLVSLSGSLVIGLAALENVLPVEELWRRSRIDETWQESQWGIDEEAAALAAAKRQDFLHAARYFALSRKNA